MLTIGERIVNEPLNNTCLYMNYKDFYFRCKVDKGYGTEQPLGFVFEFEDESSLYYNNSQHTITKIKEYGQAERFTLEDADYLYANRLKRIMMNSKNKYIAKGKNADYDNYSK